MLKKKMFFPPIFTRGICKSLKSLHSIATSSMTLPYILWETPTPFPELPLHHRASGGTCLSLICDP